MLTKAQLKTLIQNNLNNNYTYSIQLFLTEIIKRNIHDPTLPQYRITNNITNTPITDLNEFINNIDENSLKSSYYYNRPNNLFNKIAPVIVTIGNYDVKLNKTITEDLTYTFSFGYNTISKIMFIMTYMNDNDSTLPLKIADVKIG